GAGNEKPRPDMRAEPFNIDSGGAGRQSGALLSRSWRRVESVTSTGRERSRGDLVSTSESGDALGGTKGEAWTPTMGWPRPEVTRRYTSFTSREVYSLKRNSIMSPSWTT